MLRLASTCVDSGQQTSLPSFTRPLDDIQPATDEFQNPTPAYPNEGTLTFSNDNVTPKVFINMRVGLSTNAESNLLWFSTITATAPHLHAVELAVKLTSGRDLAFYTPTGRLTLGGLLGKSLAPRMDFQTTAG